MSSAAATAPAAAGAAPKKSKKLLFIIIGVVILALLGAGGAFFILKKNTAADEGEDHTAVEESLHADPGKPPTFLPLESMVVNLADPGGNRFVQLGITLQVEDEHTSDALKSFMPSIRNSILMLVSQRTAEEILKPEGKQRLAKDIIRESSRVMGYELDDAPGEGTKKRRKAPPNPLQDVLFSSFIVQ
jgi:flagellar protein FliL